MERIAAVSEEQVHEAMRAVVLREERTVTGLLLPAASDAVRAKGLQMRQRLDSLEWQQHPRQVLGLISLLSCLVLLRPRGGQRGTPRPRYPQRQNDRAPTRRGQATRTLSGTLWPERYGGHSVAGVPCHARWGRDVLATPGPHHSLHN